MAFVDKTMGDFYKICKKRALCGFSFKQNVYICIVISAVTN